MGSRKSGGTLISLDGVNGESLRQEAKKLAVENRPRGAVSHWDASGIFDEIVVAGLEAGRPSMRTLLLLYAADLAFRLRWQIKPALAEGRLLIAAPYVDTAVALGRAAGIERQWLRDLFSFTPAPSERRYIEESDSTTGDTGRGLVEYACRHTDGFLSPRELLDRTRAYLKGSGRRRRTARR